MNRSPAALADPRAILCAAALEDVPHGFLTGIGHEGEPDAKLIVANGVLVAPKQVHSALALGVDAPFAPGEMPEVDALVTATKGLVLGIVTADCAPVLLADRHAGVIAAAHAGWRGAFGGVLEAAIGKMVELGAQPERVCAAIGPTIAQPSYEVDAGFYDRLVGDDGNNAAFFNPGAPDHYQFDLPAYVKSRLEAAGIGRIDDLALDTYAQENRFHSYRRATHRNEPTYGRQYSLIALPT